MYKYILVLGLYMIGCIFSYLYGRYNGRHEGFKVGFARGIEAGGKTILKILDSTGMLKDKSEATRVFTMAEVEMTEGEEPRVRIVNDDKPE